tara:strand:- start:443 stop:625 length:183 start_codon:yes stop_codon:yes gene_type:complete
VRGPKDIARLNPEQLANQAGAIALARHLNGSWKDCPHRSQSDSPGLEARGYQHFKQRFPG